ncbi:DUF1758 domain-containing protein [Trichonephila inaurata madagascariensis]|uniref:DUF1758 domain-containing protein n=1 Tax=Trichonephila inaurata madagascariensis TaxID=2747483 RepID=A0A8X6YYF7_9ARAC|nr:DUF1758 domain-containing protein [Trichonephila inaurata madagascariensis]
MSLTSTELPKWEMFWELLQNRTQILKNLHGVQGPPLKLKTPFPNKGKSFMVKYNNNNCLLSENIQNSAEGSSSNALVTQPAPLLAHPSLLPDAVVNNPSELQTIQTFSSLNKTSNKIVFLSTAIVGIWSPVLNSYVRGRVILDSASQSHFMTLQFASKLGLEKKKIILAVSGLSENTINIKWKINNVFNSNKDSSYTFPLDFPIVSSVTDFVPYTQPNFRIKKFNDINRSFLADPTFDEPGKIDMIIGAELFNQIIKDGRKVISDNLTLINSVFGFVSGSINTVNHKSSCFLISESESIDNCKKKFREIEEIILESSRGSSSISKEEFCEMHFRDTHRRDCTGRFIVYMPVQDEELPTLGNSLILAHTKKRVNQTIKKLEIHTCTSFITNFLRSMNLLVVCKESLIIVILLLITIYRIMAFLNPKTTLQNFVWFLMGLPLPQVVEV